MVRNGDEVYLSRKQFWSIVFACITPATAVGGLLWKLNDRVTALEVTRPGIVQDIEDANDNIKSLTANASTLNRIEQHLVDIDRRLERLEEKKP